MADRIFPYGEAPDDAEFVVTEPNQDLPNAKELVAGTGISITVGADTVTISGDGSSAQTYITADDETATLPNSFQIVEGSNVTLDYVGSQLIISAQVSGTGGGTVTIVNSGNANPLFTTNVTTATTTPTIAYTLSSAASGTFFRGPASGTASAGTYGGILGTDLTGALTAGQYITLTPAVAPGSRLTIDATGLQPLSSTLNALSSSLSGTGYITQVGPNSFAERTFQDSTNITWTNPAGIAGNSSADVTDNVYTKNSSSFLNALATGLTGVGFVSQNGAQFYDRTFQGTSGRVSITNPTGAAGDPTWDVGQDVLVVGDVTALPGIQIVNGAGVIQIGATGALGGTVTSVSAGNVSPVWTTNVTSPTTTPTISYTLNDFASGQVLIGPLTGANAPPDLRRLLGEDIFDAVVAGDNVSISLVDNQLVISSTASGGGGGSVTSVSAGNLPPLFTTNVANPTTTPAVSFTFSNTASGTFLAGPASGSDGPWTNRGILGTDLTGALQAGANITISQSTPPNSRLIIAVTGPIDATLIANGSVSNTEFQYLDGVTSGIQAQLDGKQPLDATLTALAAFNSNGIMTQTAADTFTSRTITGTSNEITVSNGDGVSGNPTIGLDNNINTSHLANGSVSNTEFQYLDGVTSSIQTQLDGKLVSAGDLAPLFTTAETAGNIAFTLNNQASGIFLAGPASGSDGPWTNRGILGTDLTGALQAGSNVTITQAAEPGSRLIIASSGGSGYSTIQEEGSNLTQRNTMNFVGAAYTAADDSGNSRTNISAHTSVNSIAVTPANGQIPIGNGTNFTVNEIDAGTGISVTNAAGAITVANTAKRSTLKVKTANTSRSSTTTVSNDPDLLFAVGANETWNFRALLIPSSANAAPDFKFTCTGPSGSTVTYAGVYQNADGNSANIAATSGGTTTTVNMSANQFFVIQVSGSCANGSTPGNLSIQWAQNTLDVNATVLNAGSNLSGVEA